MDAWKTIHVVDSHTGGEPTRVVVSGGPELSGLSVAGQRSALQAHHDWLRTTVVNEPRGSDVWVGAILCEPVDPSCAAGVIFFNNVGYLGMCGHGTIGLVATLAYLGRIEPGVHAIETPVGIVSATLDATGAVSVRNVASYRTRKGVAVSLDGSRQVTGDVAWGGNWFFLVHDHGESIELRNVDRLTELAWQIRQELKQQGITGSDGSEIDHIELFGPSTIADSKNFVLCPGKAFDRSPCGTGTSAKLACLVADGKLQPGQIWRQESIVGSVFEGWVEPVDDQLYPNIRGTAYLTADSKLILNPSDPFRNGIRV